MVAPPMAPPAAWAPPPPPPPAPAAPPAPAWNPDGAAPPTDASVPPPPPPPVPVVPAPADLAAPPAPAPTDPSAVSGPAGAAGPAAPAPPAPAGDLPFVTIDAAPVTLQRNERINLTSSASGPLSRVMLDLAWEPAPGRLSVDLDASVIAFDSAGQKLEIVWYQHQSEFAGSLQHTGDAKGEGSGSAAERVLVDLGRLPDNVYALVFTISSFHGHTFTDLKQRVLRAERRHRAPDRHLQPDRHAAEHGRADGDPAQGRSRAVAVAGDRRVP